MTRTLALVLGAAVVVLALVAAGCGSSATTCGDVESGSQGVPQLVIGSDLPLHGEAGAKGRQVDAAIRLVLRQRGWKAGDFTLGYQSCDDSSPKTGKAEAGICSGNANAFAGDEEIVAVIGPLDSSCAQIAIPILNQAPDGAIPLVSPANTYSCLTHGGPGCDKSEPDKYYPSGSRNYLRLAPHDLYQAAAAAEYAKAIGVTRVYVLDDDEAYGVGVATAFRQAAKALGLEIAGGGSWDPRETSYRPLFEEISKARPDAVFLGGLISQNGMRVIADKVAVLGPNDGHVKLLAADGFAAEETINEAGPAAKDMLTIAPGLPVSELGSRAKAFAAALGAGPLAGQRVDLYALHGAQAAQLLLDAIAASDGSRDGVIRRLFESEVKDGLLGTFRFNANGDPAQARGAVVGFTVYRATTSLQPVQTISPSPETVAAAADA